MCFIVYVPEVGNNYVHRNKLGTLSYPFCAPSPQFDPLSVLGPQMVGLYKRRKNNTTDTALDFAPPTTNTGGLQQAQVTAMQDEIHVLKKQLYEVCSLAGTLL